MVEMTPSKDVITNHTLCAMRINKNVAYHTAFLYFDTSQTQLFH